VSYPLDSQEDILEHYLDSFINDDIKNDCTLIKVNRKPFGKFWGVGLNYEGTINLLNSSFGMNIYSDVTSNNPYYIYLYFKALVTL
jgi:hypothetical protein